MKRHGLWPKPSVVILVIVGTILVTCFIQGRHLRLVAGKFGIQRVKLYRYR